MIMQVNPVITKVMDVYYEHGVIWDMRHGMSSLTMDQQ